MTNLQLRRLFLRFNRVYWNNRLPKDTIVKFSKMDSDSLGFCYLYKNLGEIHISKELRTWPNVAELTLHHEMCHLALPAGAGHGPKFHKEMKRLAKRNAFRFCW